MRDFNAFHNVAIIPPTLISRRVSLLLAEIEIFWMKRSKTCHLVVFRWREIWKFILTTMCLELLPSSITNFGDEEPHHQMYSSQTFYITKRTTSGRRKVGRESLVARLNCWFPYIFIFNCCFWFVHLVLIFFCIWFSLYFPSKLKQHRQRQQSVERERMKIISQTFPVFFSPSFLLALARWIKNKFPRHIFYSFFHHFQFSSL